MQVTPGRPAPRRAIVLNPGFVLAESPGPAGGQEQAWEGGALQAPHAHSGVHTCCGLACARRPASLTSAAAFAEQIRSAASRSLLSRRRQRARPRTPPSAPGRLGDTHGPALRERTNPPAGRGGNPSLLAGGTRFLQGDQTKRNPKPRTSPWPEGQRQRPLQAPQAAGCFSGNAAHGTPGAERTV